MLMDTPETPLPLERLDRPLGLAPVVRRPVLLYSAGCRFCRWAARVVATLDRGERLALLPLGTDEAADLLASIPEGARADSWWLVQGDRKPIAGKSGAAVVLLAEMRVTSWMARLLVFARLSPILDRLDALIARHRAGMSRFVPEGPAPRRFP